MVVVDMDIESTDQLVSLDGQFIVLAIRNIQIGILSILVQTIGQQMVLFTLVVGEVELVDPRQVIEQEEVDKELPY